MSGLAAARTSTGVLAQVPAYLKIVAATAQIAYTYRFNVLLDLGGVLLQVFLLKVVWTAVYADRGAVDGVELVALLTYLTIANILIAIVRPDSGWLLQQEVRDGKVAQSLARPISLLGQLVFQQVGHTLGTLPLVLAVIPLAFFAGVLRPPASPEAGALFVVSVLLAYVVATAMGLLLGMVAFWTLETTGIWAIYRFANLFFAGGLVPLWLFPGPLRAIAEVLPFQTQAAIPVSIYIGRVAGAEALQGLLVQVFWVVVLGLIVRWVWSRALRRVVIQGG